MALGDFVDLAKYQTLLVLFVPKTQLRHKHQMSVQGHQGQVSEQGFKFRGDWLLDKIRTIYFYINTHLHNSSPVACRENPCRLLLSGQLQTYLWEYVGHRVGIVVAE